MSAPDPKAVAYLDGLSAFSRSLQEGGRFDQVVNYSTFLRVGERWAQEVIDSRSIPSGKAKSVEMAVRLFGGGRRPKDLQKWWAKNEKRFQLLADATRWPERTEGDEQFRLGPFTVHNTVHATGKKLERAKGAIDKALKALNSEGVRAIPGFKGMARDDLYLVGQIGRKNWGAWYMKGPDAIYVRPNVRGLGEADVARHIVHELAHRYWLKKLNNDAKKEWVKYHNALRQGLDVSLPKEGEAVPFEVNGKKGVTVHYKEKPGKIILKDTSGEAIGMTNPRTLFKWMQDSVVMGAYPTNYAATDPEEHFAEAVSLLAFDDLSDDGAADLLDIIEGIPLNQPSGAKVARRVEAGLRDLRYGPPTEEQQESLDRRTPQRYALELPLLPVPSISQTLQELTVLQSLADTQRAEHLDFIQRADKDLVGLFEDLCERLGLPWPEEAIRSIVDDSTIVITKLKFRFNRPRPFQVAQALGYDFEPVGTLTGHSPAYPSGHTIQSKLIAFHLADLYRDHMEDFFRLASQISWSRALMGVHWPSDLSYGEGIARRMARRNDAVLRVASAARVAALYDEGRVGEYWGSAGSGFLFTTGDRILLLKRAPWVDQPGTWGIPGGAIPVDSDTGKPISPLRGALKEVREEVGMVPSYRMYDTYVFRDGSFSFTTFIATTEEFTPRLNHENTDYVWADREEALQLRLHPGVKKLLAIKDPFTSETTRVASLKFVDERSPRLPHARRFKITDPEAEPPGREDYLFKEKKRLFSERAPYKRLKKPVVDTPGVTDPGDIAYIDYSGGGKDVYIHLAIVRPGRRGQGLATKLLRAFYKKHLSKGGTARWGRVLNPAAWALFEKMKAEHPDVLHMGLRFF